MEPRLASDSWVLRSQCALTLGFPVLQISETYFAQVLKTKNVDLKGFHTHYTPQSHMRQEQGFLPSAFLKAQIREPQKPVRWPVC